MNELKTLETEFQNSIEKLKTQKQLLKKLQKTVDLSRLDQNSLKKSNAKHLDEVKKYCIK
jgi:hypothetical protein